MTQRRLSLGVGFNDNLSPYYVGRGDELHSLKLSTDTTGVYDPVKLAEERENPEPAEEGHGFFNTLKNLAQSTLKRVLETHVGGVEGSIINNEVRNIQDLQFLKEYESKRNEALMATKMKEADKYNELSTWLKENATEYDRVIKSNPNITDLYFQNDPVTPQPTGQPNYAYNAR